MLSIRLSTLIQVHHFQVIFSLISVVFSLFLEHAHVPCDTSNVDVAEIDDHRCYKGEAFQMCDLREHARLMPV